MSGSPATNLIARLQGVKERGPGKWEARCPAHEDGRASLSITERPEGHVLLHCFAECEPETVVAAVGLTMRDLFPQKEAEKKEVAAYDYRGEDGRLLFQSVRFEPKSFLQRRPDGAGGWIWNLKGVTPVPYRLPELIKAVAASERIFITEGEKDADRLAGLGLAATTNAGGAGKWRPGFGQWFREASVIILPDNDAAGEKHAKQVARHLYGYATSIRILNLPELPEKGDASDWLNRGGTREELETLADAEDDTDEVPTTDDAALLKNFEIERIEKVNTEEPVYYVHVMGGIARMTIEDLASFTRFKVAVVRNLNRVPDMRNPQLNWHTYLDRCLQNKLEVIPAPEEAGGEASLWHRVWRYLSSKAIEDETALAELRGVYANERYIYFHGPSLHTFLCSRGAVVKPGDLWDVIRKRGGESLLKKVKDSKGEDRVVRSWRLEKVALEVARDEE